MQSLYLTGFMGAGKTSVGKLLAERLDMPFIDTDRSVELRAGISIPRIFATKGEAFFRELEREVCLGVPRGVVAALGGGTFLDASIRERIRRTGLSIFLDWPFEILAKRIADDPDRPLSVSGPDLARRFQQRHPVYSCADIVWKSQVPHESAVAEVADSVFERLARHPAWKGLGEGKNATSNGSDPAKV